MAVATRGTKAPKKAVNKASSRSKAPAKAATPPRSTRPRREERVISETPPSVIEEIEIEAPSYRDQVRELKERLAEYEYRHKQYRIHKSRSHRHRRHRRHYSSESSTDSEEGDGPRVSFLHAEGTYPFLKLHERYRAVEIKYFKQIFFGTFKSENLTKLGRGYANRAGTNGTQQEANGMVHLLQCFEVYGQSICYFAHPTVALRLQEALSDYRFRLAELSALYKFDSIREYHCAFMNARILNGQDDPTAWITEDRRCSDLLLRDINLGAAPKSSASDLEICRDFNEGRCSREHCKYCHICLNCQLDHPANTCHKADTD